MTDLDWQDSDPVPEDRTDNNSVPDHTTDMDRPDNDPVTEHMIDMDQSGNHPVP